MLICRDSISVCPVLVKSVQLCFQQYPYGCSSPSTKVHVDDTLTAATTTAVAAAKCSRTWMCSACIFILNCLMCYYNMLSNFDKNASYWKEIETYWSEILFQSFCWGQCNGVISFEFCCSLVKLCLFNLRIAYLVWAYCALTLPEKSRRPQRSVPVFKIGGAVRRANFSGLLKIIAGYCWNSSRKNNCNVRRLCDPYCCFIYIIHLVKG